LPDAPPVGDAVPGYDVDVWQGIMAPAGTPAAVIARLNAEFNRALKVAAVKEKLAAQGIDTAGGTPQEFRAKIASDLDKYARIVKAANIRPD
jgi:tripartite-type tricarboxylate transporter receptor subunit TctC